MIQTWTERTHEAINGKRGLLLVWSFLCAVILEFIAIFDPTLYGAKADSVQAIVFLFSTMVVSFMLYPRLMTNRAKCITRIWSQETLVLGI